MSFRARVPQLVPASLNVREHWRARSVRVKRDRADVCLVLSARVAPPLPAIVTLVRCAPHLLDSDNAVGAMKAVRDEVADWLGLPNDRDPRVTWRVQQMRTPKNRQGTLILIESRSAT